MQLFRKQEDTKGEKNKDKDQSHMKAHCNKKRTPPLGKHMNDGKTNEVGNTWSETNIGKCALRLKGKDSNR